MTVVKMFTVSVYITVDGEYYSHMYDIEVRADDVEDAERIVLAREPCAVVCVTNQWLAHE